MILSAMQRQAAEILQGDSAFAGCPIVVVDKGGIAALIDEALAAAGTAILIAPPSARFTANGGQGPVSTDGGVRMIVQVIEPPGVGRPAGLMSALDLAETAGRLLHSANHPDRSDSVPLGLEELAAQPDPDTLIVQLVLVATASLSPPATQTQG